MFSSKVRNKGIWSSWLIATAIILMPSTW
jgi:hypothetical protein